MNILFFKKFSFFLTKNSFWTKTSCLDKNFIFDEHFVFVKSQNFGEKYYVGGQNCSAGDMALLHYRSVKFFVAPKELFTSSK